MRFVLMRGTSSGPAFLARPDQPDDADAWTASLEDALRFGSRDAADAKRGEIVGRDGVAVAVMPHDGGDA